MHVFHTKFYKNLSIFSEIINGKSTDCESHTYSDPVIPCKGKESVPDMLLSLRPQLNGGRCSFHTLSFCKKYFPLTGANTTINSSENSLAGVKA